MADDVAKLMPRLGVEIGTYLGTGGGKGVVGMIEAFVLKNKMMPANELTHNVLLIAKAHPLPSLLSLIALYLHDVNPTASKQVLNLETDPTSKTMAMCEVRVCEVQSEELGRRVYWTTTYMANTSVRGIAAANFCAASNITNDPSIATRFARRR